MDDGGALSAFDRRRHIVACVQEQGGVRLEQLRTLFKVSSVTLRRDMEILESKNLITRVRGGAVANTVPPLETLFQEKLSEHPDEKREIAAAAAALVSDGQVVMLSAGTTATYIARELVKKHDVMVVTSAINIAAELAGYENITLIVIGGIARPGSYAMVGHMADQALSTLNADFSFIGVDGVDLTAGFTTPNLMEAHTDGVMLRAGRKSVIVADHSKFGRVALSPVARLQEASMLITDHGADAAYIAALRERGCQVIVSSRLDAGRLLHGEA